MTGSTPPPTDPPAEWVEALRVALSGDAYTEAEAAGVLAALWPLVVARETQLRTERDALLRNLNQAVDEAKGLRTENERLRDMLELHQLGACTPARNEGWEPGQVQPAPKIAMDARGRYWRWFPDLGEGGMFSMVPTSSDNDAFPLPFVWYVPEVVGDGGKGR